MSIGYRIAYILLSMLFTLINSLDESNPWLGFTIKDLPLVLILIIADQILNDSLCCPNKTTDV